MNKRFLITLSTLLACSLTFGCTNKIDISNKEEIPTNTISASIDSINEAQSALEDYIKAINDKNESLMTKVIDNKTVTRLSASEIETIKLTNIQHYPEYNSIDTPPDTHLAFIISYDVEYITGDKNSEKKWIALEKVNNNWFIRGVAKQN